MLAIDSHTVYTVYMYLMRYLNQKSCVNVILIEVTTNIIFVMVTKAHLHLIFHFPTAKELFQCHPYFIVLPICSDHPIKNCVSFVFIMIIVGTLRGMLSLSLCSLLFLSFSFSLPLSLSLPWSSLGPWVGGCAPCKGWAGCPGRTAGSRGGQTSPQSPAI